MNTRILNITFLLAFILLGCKTQQPESEQSAVEVPIVKVLEAKERPYIQTLSFSGTVYANREANLGAALPGKVEKIFFNEGEAVKQGDLIVELSDEMLTQAEVENQAIRKDYERVKRLRERGSISEMEYDHVKAKLEASDAKTQMVRKNTRVYAPFSGTIVERMMEEGEIFFINPGLDPGYSMRSGIVRLMQLSPVKVQFDVNEKDLHLVRQGLSAQIELDAISDKKYPGKISKIKPILSTLSRTATAEIILKNPDGLLMPGMFARITIDLPGKEGVFVPISCISRLPGTGEDFVYIVDESMTARKTIIQRLTTDNNMVAVQGVGAGQRVITEGMTRVYDGQKVEIQ